MDKNAIKTYAVWARNELRDRVSKKLDQYEITASADANADSVRGKLLTKDEKSQRAKAIEKVKEKGIDQVIEEVAYTWFNRFSALRFMEVNNYLPTRIRVFTDENNEFKPQILSEAIHMELDGLDMEKVYDLKEKNNNDELFKYLIITQCNALSKILPGMFQKIADYTELLFPDNLLRDGSVIEQMISLIPEDNWTDQVQIIGWLYQYYNSEPKDKVFAELKKNIKITKEKIPAATQLFTPDWIVHYMVENSLGRLWLECHPNDDLKSSWKYYLDEVEQEPEVKLKLSEIRKEYAGLNPEDILVIDPCQGSGHILCVFFDTLMSIYETFGYSTRDSVRNIVEKNLWGLDIDDRAAQLAYFSVMMKARQYDSRFFVRTSEDGKLHIPQPHVYGIMDSNGMEYDGDYDEFLLGEEHLDTLKYLLTKFKDAKEYGSILNVEKRDYEGFLKAWKLTAEQTLRDVRMLGWYMHVENDIVSLAKQAIALSQSYHAVVTNPPYMNWSGMNSKLQTYLKNNYADTRSDLSTVFMEKSFDFCVKEGFVAMINIPVWMFITSYKKLREQIIFHKIIVNMLHLGRGIFGSDFGTTSFVIRNSEVDEYKSLFYKLYLRQGAVDSVEEKEKMFKNRIGEYVSKQNAFSVITDSPIAYWASEQLLNDFRSGTLVGEFAKPKQGMSTCDVNRFSKLWYEIDINRSNIREKENIHAWVKYNKGGNYRKWYGNREYLVYWGADGSELLANGALLRNRESYFKPFLAWTKISSAGTGFRMFEDYFLFDGAGGSLFNESKLFSDKYLLGMLNSKVCTTILNLISPTLNFNENHIASIPILKCEDKDKISLTENLVDDCIRLSKQDWNSFETSWDYSCDPIVTKALSRDQWGGDGPISIEHVYKLVSQDFEESFQRLKENEEELNRIFIDIYGLHDELTPQVEDKDVTVRRPDRKLDIKNFISYAVGCMMGRYNYGDSGLEYAGGTWDASKYKKYPADKDGILPICDDEYFEDDIVGRFVDFVKEVFGAETLEENLIYIADSLGGSGAPREVIRNYFLNSFYADHVKMYQKRPLYWLFDSGKKNGFKCLVYMHRYKPDTIARIRTDYVHEQQSRYRTAIAGLERQIADASTSERVRLNKRLSTLKDQAEETRKYEEKIHHLADQMISIDLDDGVKHNYEIFKDVLAKIY